MISFLLLASFYAVYGVYAAEFPSAVPRCKMGDGACMVKIANEVILKQFSAGLPELGLPSLDPLRVDRLTIEQGGKSPINIKLFFKNLEYFGFSHATFTQITGLGEQIDNAKLTMELKVPVVTQVGAYKINGKVLVLPIQGTGTSNMTLVKPVMKIKALSKSVMKDGEEYLQFEKLKVNINVARLHMDFTNLFNGNKELGDNMNLFLNDNWKDIYGELKVPIQNSFGEVVKNTMNSVFMQMPYKKLFL